MLQVQASPTTSLSKPSFIQRSTSIASLVAWKERFECYSGRFAKQPSFVSFVIEEDMPCKLANNTTDPIYNAGPSNDPPPEYTSTTTAAENPPPFFSTDIPQKKVDFHQDFTALETYLKKKLCLQKKGSFNACSHSAVDTSKVFQWIHELPEGDNLEEFLEAYGIPIKGVDIEELKEKLRAFISERLNVADMNINNEDASIPHWQRQMSDLENLAHGDNLEKWLESLDVPFFRPVPEIKRDIRKFLHLPETDEEETSHIHVQPSTKPQVPLMPSIKEMEAFVPKWKELIDKMGALKNEEDLDKWLESLDIPHNVEKARIHHEIKKFFRHETFENFAGKSIIFKEHHIAKQLWDKFEDSTVLKQVAMVAGTTAVLGLIAVLSTTLLSFAVPAAFAINPFFVEVFSQYFLQRNEVAFNLLNFHAAQAKPLSTAWAKQYVLWKYC